MSVERPPLSPVDEVRINDDVDGEVIGSILSFGTFYYQVRGEDGLIRRVTPYEIDQRGEP